MVVKVVNVVVVVVVLVVSIMNMMMEVGNLVAGIFRRRSVEKLVNGIDVRWLMIIMIFVDHVFVH